MTPERKIEHDAEARRIVKDLASSRQYADKRAKECDYCDIYLKDEQIMDGRSLVEPAEHPPDCLWRRAKEWLVAQ